MVNCCVVSVKLRRSFRSFVKAASFPCCCLLRAVPLMGWAFSKYDPLFPNSFHERSTEVASQ
eukprot:scaffold503_cov375-Pinguiococcus_pyrenoidosus.AAC.8